MDLNNQYSDITDANSSGSLNVTDIVSLVNTIIE